MQIEHKTLYLSRMAYLPPDKTHVIALVCNHFSKEARTDKRVHSIVFIETFVEFRKSIHMWHIAHFTNNTCECR